MSYVYSPAEDSRLLLKHAYPRFRGSVLDMGTGSGYLAIEAATHPAVKHVIAVDINPESVKAVKQIVLSEDISVDVRQGDLFESIGDETFDLIVFNAPYLPSDGVPEEQSWSGGIIGKEILVRFLSEASKYLEQNGEILVVYSDKTGISEEEFRKKYYFELLEEYPLFFERLFCVLLKPL